MKKKQGTRDVLEKIENNKEATDKMFTDLKAKSKVRMNNLKVKFTGVCYT